ncbi:MULTISPECIES: Coenzyme F420 hydrogenase/dehydrogenase, beta subunit C-terminal domain [unclassified Stenotrophomonas]|uniref:Coenzyme F420 hydrogenase/dehydrogenase, beta subunit C-terminal domain n=1 Tax=unclassified Stenotrophomonas TaxID=196198 RepID=UPI001E3F54D6|nr:MULTISPECIES: Coenzyme F420 hydrogenase/dehydrogenase, beta subunit C-terminal domain [unclassified Stenotrophomonas]
MDWDPDGFLVPKKVSASNIPEAAFSACPFPKEGDTNALDEDALAGIFLRDSSRSDPKVGRFENTYIGHAPAHRETSSSGGLATYVFHEILRRKIVDHIFVVSQDGAAFKYRLVSSAEEVDATSKTRYFPVTLEDFFSITETMDGKIGVSGVACFVKAVRIYQAQNPRYAEKIPFIVGIICGGLKSASFTDYLADKAGAGDNYQYPQYRIKDAKSSANDYSFAAISADGNQHSIKMARVGDMWGTGMFKAKACDFCTDVLTELADISLGDAWLPVYREDGLGHNVLVTRTKVADEILQEGISDGSLTVASADPSQIISSQRASFAHRWDALQFRIRLAKFLRHPVPAVRQRVLKKVPILQSLVQIQRERTRFASISHWRRKPLAKHFDIRMFPHRALLKIFTKLNHWAR